MAVPSKLPLLGIMVNELSFRINYPLCLPFLSDFTSDFSIDDLRPMGTSRKGSSSKKTTPGMEVDGLKLTE